MPAHFTHTCDKCNFSTTTLDPWEFHKNEDGKIEKLPHPGCDRRLIDGYIMQAYCPVCNKNVEVITIEYNMPLHYRVERTNRWLVGFFFTVPRWIVKRSVKEEYRKQEKYKCPECGSADLIVSPDYENEDEIKKCPKCKEKSLVSKKDWIS